MEMFSQKSFSLFALKQAFPTWSTRTPSGTLAYLKGYIYIRLAIEGKSIFYISFISKYLYIYQ